MALRPPSTINRRAVAYLDMAERRAVIPQWLDASTPLRRLVRDYWREEVRLNSPALARLRDICEQRGYDYDSTVEALG